jgi:alkylation response protein AidB-like acyl-CoA dehydrogenase
VAIVIEEVARACASSSLIPAVNKLGTVPLLLAASEEVKARYLTPVARGDAMFSYALSEPEAGSDAAAMRTRAVRSAAGYVLNGVKRWITNAGVGFKIALRTLDHTRITIAAQALGIAQGALDYALGYVRERKQFGQPIAEFQGLQFMMADMAMKLEAARQLTYAAAARSDRAMAGERVADLTFFSSACKCLASDVAMQVTTDAVQLLGGYGYVNDYPVERMMRDAKITQIYEGTNQIQRVVMARQLLKG